MLKKELDAIVDTMVLSVQSTANAAPGNDTLLTEDEARTLTGMRLKKTLRAFVAEVAGCDAEAVVIQIPVAKPKKAKETVDA